LVLACAAALAAMFSGVGAGTARSDAVTCPTPTPGPDATRVMVTGDSLSQGSAGDWTWRYRLWKHLQAGGVDVDFVGPFDFLFDNLSFNAFGGHDYADPCFDADHYALAGSTYADLLTPPKASPSSSSGISWAVSTYRPDVVVVLAGANDLHQGATVDEVLTRAKSALDEIRGANPGATVVMVTLPTTQMPDTVPDYNSRLAALVPTWSTSESPVVLADAMRDWAGVSDTWDGWHPNAMGEMHVAADIEDAFHAIGLGAAAERPIPQVPLGPTVPPTLAVQTGDGAATLSWVSPPGADREYVWYRDVTGDGAWTLLADPVVAAGGTAVANLENGREYAFRVQAAKGTAVAEQIYSNVVDATPAPSSDPSPTPTPTPTPTATPAPPPSPTTSPLPSPTAGSSAPTVLSRVGGLSGSALHHAVGLAWQPVAEATSYTVRWRPTDADAYTGIETTDTGLVVSGLVAGQSYAFEVRARQGGVLGPPGPEAVVTPGGTVTVEAAPPRLRQAARHRLRISWPASVDATRYDVQVRRPGGTWRTVAGTTGTRVVSRALRPGRVYAVRIQPWDQLLAGRPSPTARLRLR
jgi:lysophospholipase L1-like esterase